MGVDCRLELGDELHDLDRLHRFAPEVPVGERLPRSVALERVRALRAAEDRELWLHWYGVAEELLARSDQETVVFYADNAVQAFWQPRIRRVVEEDLGVRVGQPVGEALGRLLEPDAEALERLGARPFVRLPWWVQVVVQRYGDPYVLEVACDSLGHQGLALTVAEGRILSYSP